MEYKWKKYEKPQLNNKRWEKRFLELKEFVKQNARYPLSTVNGSKEFRLYQWMSTQKMAKTGVIGINLSKEKIDKLESLPNWKWRKDEQ
jgi:hypothetical protein